LERYRLEALSNFGTRPPLGQFGEAAEVLGSIVDLQSGSLPAGDGGGTLIAAEIPL
jgi:hypothetical protein